MSQRRRVVSLRVQDFEGLHEANNIKTLESVLMKRDKNDSNSFWLSHGSKRNPSLALLVKGGLAGLHYFPEESHPGFVPSGNTAGLPSGETTTFYMDSGGEEVQILNDAIVPFSTALIVSKEFFFSDALPTSIKWAEL
jgi:hypothetical protein